MGSQITLTMSLVFIGLFSIAIFGFAIGFANDTGAVMSIADDTEFNDFSTDNENSLSDFKDDSKGTYESILDTTVEPGSNVAQSTGPFAVSTPGVIAIGTNIIKLPYQKIFGSGEGFGIFFTVFGGVIALLFGFYVYKTLRGNP